MSSSPSILLLKNNTLHRVSKIVIKHTKCSNDSQETALSSKHSQNAKHLLQAYNLFLLHILNFAIGEIDNVFKKFCL